MSETYQSLLFFVVNVTHSPDIQTISYIAKHGIAIESHQIQIFKIYCYTNKYQTNF